MSAPVTPSRKRGRAEEEEDLPPAKRELGQDEGAGAGGTASAPTAVEGEGQASLRAREAARKDEEFWLEDGTVILVARDVEFRVYKGLLSSLSPVFKALFAECQTLRRVSVDEQQTLSCPVVPVSDSPEDLRHLLRVCFTKRLGRLYDERHPSYHEISAAIRLGDKYKITELYSQSLEYLKRHFPSTLDGWLALKRYGPPGWDDFEEIGVVNLARHTGELSLLPSALIACICAQSTSDPGGKDKGIGHGFAREDGSREHLSADDLTLCFDGKTNLRTATIAAVLRTFKPAASAECRGAPRPRACEDALRGVLLGLEGTLDVLLGGDPFAGYEEFVDSDRLGLCKACKEMVRKRSYKERKDIWDRLPELLDVDVPGWRA
ncbi:hypothetical protein GSI_12036 [Ganoderma sinense ZZ0214-1]|uniref:BTB domain-containing protein n=1 Tax=Ganoderma sinense ZZ0214-1 TaxID=1077348 RepID=A0A2G8RXN8_9APHY|nr:hypothetical protein GSI_12036 [Ganoderma sinense ZZ0214-1]